MWPQQTRDSTLSYGIKPESLSYLGLNGYRVVTDGRNKDRHGQCWYVTHVSLYELCLCESSVPRSVEAVKAGARELSAHSARRGRWCGAVPDRCCQQWPASAQHSNVLLRPPSASHHWCRVLHADAVVLRPAWHHRTLRRHRHHGTTNNIVVTVVGHNKHLVVVDYIGVVI